MQISNALTPIAGFMPSSASSSGGSANGFQAALGNANSLAASSSSGSSSEDPAQAFLDYMKETPAQQMEDAWLAAHHLTRKQLEARSPDQRQALEKQMAEDIKNQIKQAADKKAHGTLNILA